MVPLALSASAALSPFGRGSKGWAKSFPTSSGRYAANLVLFARFPRKEFSFAASGTTGSIGGIVQTSDGDTAMPSYKWTDKQKPRVCILGGGFGGLYTALRLESLVWPNDKKPQVLLVDQSDHFVFKPMLYELLSGEVEAWEIAPRFSDLLANTSVQFFKDKVKLLHPSDHLGRNGPTRSGCGGTVHLESGTVIEYD